MMISQGRGAYLTTATAAVKDSVGAGAVPGHADKETAIVAVVGRPPLLGISHEVVEVLLETPVIEVLEGLGIVKLIAEGVGDAGVLAEGVEPELVGPPVAALGAAAGDVHVRALAFRHVCGRSRGELAFI